MNRRLSTIAAYGILTLSSLVFLYPFYWLIVSSFRTQSAMLTHPLRLLPESFNLSAYESIRRVGGVPIETYALNSIGITLASTVLAVVVTALGAYALYRRPQLPGFGILQFVFLLTMMYPAMLLAIPTYLVVYRLGLLGTYSGIILMLSFQPVLFLMLLQFFRSIPRELVESAKMDGATELQILLRIVLPIARPILYTVFLIGFLLNWKQWLPIMIVSSSPEQYTLPVALLAMNSEYGVNFQSTMALAALTTIPIVILFLLTQKRVIGGFIAGAVKG
jgi:ABC-type glycerol-3-phosphate transport system permease component